MEHDAMSSGRVITDASLLDVFHFAKTIVKCTTVTVVSTFFTRSRGPGKRPIDNRLPSL